MCKDVSFDAAVSQTFARVIKKPREDGFYADMHDGKIYPIEVVSLENKRIIGPAFQEGDVVTGSIGGPKHGEKFFVNKVISQTSPKKAVLGA